MIFQIDITLTLLIFKDTVKQTLLRSLFSLPAAGDSCMVYPKDDAGGDVVMGWIRVK